jgi:methylated-DNA-protein-cysteine methyltransferase related protein
VSTDATGPFTRRILEVVGSTRPGEVLTYGEVAREAGRPQAARAVGSALARHGSGVPWWRVVSASGRLVPGREADHRDRLEAEGVACDGHRIAAGRTRG